MHERVSDEFSRVFLKIHLFNGERGKQIGCQNLIEVGQRKIRSGNIQGSKSDPEILTMYLG